MAQKRMTGVRVVCDLNCEEEKKRARRSASSSYLKTFLSILILTSTLTSRFRIAVQIMKAGKLCCSVPKHHSSSVQ